MGRFWALFIRIEYMNSPDVPQCNSAKAPKHRVSCSPSTSSVEVGSVHWAHSKHASETSCAAGGWWLG